jgi:hypothetical protein
VLQRWFLARLFFEPEDGATFLTNVGWLSTDYTEDRTVHNNRCENLRSYMNINFPKCQSNVGKSWITLVLFFVTILILWIYTSTPSYVFTA